MDPNDREDIIKKINTAGENKSTNGDVSDGDDNSIDSDNSFSEGIEIYPKDRKQVFKNPKLGVNESNDFESLNKNGIFVKNKDMSETIEPLVKPKTTPIVKPNEQPKRREKPWRITPQESPQPKK